MDTTKRIFGLLGNRWTLAHLRLLEESNQSRARFSDFINKIPSLSKRMSSLCLRALEREGLVERSVYDEVPVRVEYELTLLGRELIQKATEFSSWVDTHLTDFERARSAFDEKSRSIRNELTR